MKCKILAVASIGLVIVLVLSVLFILVFNLPDLDMPTQSGAGEGDQVQVSGTIGISQNGTIQFAEIFPGTIVASAPIRDWKYSVSLVGGTYYDVYVIGKNNTITKASLYVPEGVTTFIADF